MLGVWERCGVGAAIGAAMLLSACIPQGHGTAVRSAPPVAANQHSSQFNMDANTDAAALDASSRPTWERGQKGPSRSPVAGGAYVVRSGDTGIAIARAQGVRWSDMVALNQLQPPYILRVGQELRVPAAAGAAVKGAVAPNMASERGGYRPSVPSVAGNADRLERRAAAFAIGIDDIVTGSQPALARGRKATAAVDRPAAAVQTALAQPQTFDGEFRWPLRGRTLSGFGANRDGRINDGINIAAALGTPVQAAASGAVVYAGDAIGAFGRLVLIDHGGGWITAYAHLGRFDVVRGEQVRAGQLIGRVGQTGDVRAPQLHFEIRSQRTAVDPVQKLPRA